MPLDLSTLDVPRWLASYALRQSSGKENESQTVEATATATALVESLLAATAQHKAAMAAHQDARRRQRKESNQQKGKEDRKAWQERIDGLQAKEQQTQEALQQLLETLPNYVDQDIISGNYNYNCTHEVARDRDTASMTLKVPSTLAMDHNPAFELAFYERIGQDIVVWTRNGSLLCHALSQYTIHNLNIQNESFSLWEMPYQMPFNSIGAPVPSWKVMTASSAVANQSLLDRELPRFHIIQGTTQRSTQNETAGQQAFFSNRKKQSTVCWFNQLSTDHYINLLAVAGPNLTVDSRPLQMQLIQKFQTILERISQPPFSEEGNVHSQSTALWRIVAVPPHELQPDESSCLLLQTAVATDKSTTGKCRTTKRIFKTIVIVSNLESYQSLHLKHKTTREPLHIVLVQLAQMGELVDWIVKEATRNGNQSIFRVPTCLLPLLAPNDSLEFPVLRKVVMGKNGKRSVQAAYLSSETANTKNPNQVPVTSQRRTRQFLPWDPTLGEVTPEQIRGEALTCPFEFLPFHEK